MGDLVSRQAVEEMIKAEMPERGMWEIEGDKEKETVCEVCVDLMQKLSDLPSVENKEENRPKGYWKVGFGNTWCSCSECSGNGSTNWSYCPWCGADMRT